MVLPSLINLRPDIVDDVKCVVFPPHIFSIGIYHFGRLTLTDNTITFKRSKSTERYYICTRFDLYFQVGKFTPTQAFFFFQEFGVTTFFL